MKATKKVLRFLLGVIACFPYAVSLLFFVLERLLFALSYLIVGDLIRVRRILNELKERFKL